MRITVGGAGKSSDKRADRRPRARPDESGKSWTSSHEWKWHFKYRQRRDAPESTQKGSEAETFVRSSFLVSEHRVGARLLDAAAMNHDGVPPLELRVSTDLTERRGGSGRVLEDGEELVAHGPF